MAKRPERSRAQEINTWVQTIGIVIAAAWGVYTFIYKEVLLPKSAPVNISVNLQLKKIGPSTVQRSDSKKQLVAVELRVSATNPSTREVFLLPSAWLAYGYTDTASGDLLPAAAEEAINGRIGQYVQRHVSTDVATIVAVGSLFADTTLKPNETTTSTVIISVPAGTYDRIEVHAIMPTINKEGRIALEWKLDSSGITPVLFRLNAKNEKTEIPKDSSGIYADPELGLQMAQSISQVSLWQ